MSRRPEYYSPRFPPARESFWREWLNILRPDSPFEWTLLGLLTLIILWLGVGLSFDHGSFITSEFGILGHPDHPFNVTDYYPIGTIKSEIEMKSKDEHTPHGKAKTWHRNGQLESEGEYRDGHEIGVWKTWDRSGVLTAKKYYWHSSVTVLGPWRTALLWIWNSIFFIPFKGLIIFVFLIFYSIWSLFIGIGHGFQWLWEKCVEFLEWLAGFILLLLLAAHAANSSKTNGSKT